MRFIEDSGYQSKVLQIFKVCLLVWNIVEQILAVVSKIQKWTQKVVQIFRLNGDKALIEEVMSDLDRLNMGLGS